MTATHTCATCRAYFAHTDTEYGECRASQPPSYTDDAAAPEKWARWPLVAAATVADCYRPGAVAQGKGVGE